MFQYVKARGGLDEADARWFFQQLVIGLDYCHRMGVVNRDIKLENTLLDGGSRPLLKICDFGYSKNEKDSLPKSKVGTPVRYEFFDIFSRFFPEEIKRRNNSLFSLSLSYNTQQGYTAPEVVSNARSYDGRAADVWSSAVMLFVMLFCEYPFERVGDGQGTGNKFAKVLERIQKVDYRFPSNIPVSEDCKDLISKVLVADVGKRLTIEQIQAHPWYKVDLPPGVTSMNEQVSFGYSSPLYFPSKVFFSFFLCRAHHSSLFKSKNCSENHSKSKLKIGSASLSRANRPDSKPKKRSRASSWPRSVKGEPQELRRQLPRPRRRPEVGEKEESTMNSSTRRSRRTLATTNIKDSCFVCLPPLCPPPPRHPPVFPSTI